MKFGISGKIWTENGEEKFNLCVKQLTERLTFIEKRGEDLIFNEGVISLTRLPKEIIIHLKDVKNTASLNRIINVVSEVFPNFYLSLSFKGEFDFDFIKATLRRNAIQYFEDKEGGLSAEISIQGQKISLTCYPTSGIINLRGKLQGKISLKKIDSLLGGMSEVISVRVPIWLKETCEKIAEKEGISVSDLIRKALKHYLENLVC